MRIVALLLALVAIGCEAPSLDARVRHHRIQAELDPAEHRIAAASQIELAVPEALEGRWLLRFELNRALQIETLEVDGAQLRRWKIESRPDEPDIVRVLVEKPSPNLSLTIEYAGKLEQDVAAGEASEEIHNFEVSAHVAPEGIYLEPRGRWYPRLVSVEDRDPALGLTSFELEVAPIEGFELVAGAERIEPSQQRWKSPFPVDGLVLLGGPLERHSRRHGEIWLHAVIAPGKSEVGEDLLDASAELLDRYEPLIGPYPFSEFTVLEAFFSSGFAFPTCTQLAGVLLDSHGQYRRHGYLDHELLHAWWGNGIYVDPRDGNWCEGLASYGANYAGHVIDGNPVEARKMRRNYCNFLSRIEPENDKPLGTFGLEAGAGRGIGYQKGAMVFQMLEREIGSDAIAEGLRRLTAEQMGRHIDWEAIRTTMEGVSNRSLERFFEQWVRGPGAPRLRLVAGELDGTALSLTIAQGEPPFSLSVPLRVDYGDRVEDVEVELDQSEARVELTVDAGARAVELDPDYYLFRRLAPEETMPTSALTRGDDRLLIVLPEGELADGYTTVRDSFESALDDGEVEIVATDALDTGDFESRSLLILGEAVHHPAVAELLGRTRAPVRFGVHGFTVDEHLFESPAHAIYFTVHHPDDATHGLTVYAGNSEAALSNAAILNFYPNSLLVFESREDGSRARVVERRDFEFPDRIEL